MWLASDPVNARGITTLPFGPESDQFSPLATSASKTSRERCATLNV